MARSRRLISICLYSQQLSINGGAGTTSLATARITAARKSSMVGGTELAAQAVSAAARMRAVESATAPALHDRQPAPQIPVVAHMAHGCHLAA